MFRRKPKEAPPVFDFPLPLSPEQKDKQLLQGHLYARTIINRVANRFALSPVYQLGGVRNDSELLSKLKKHEAGTSYLTLEIPSSGDNVVAYMAIVTSPKDGVSLVKQTRGAKESSNLTFVTLGKPQSAADIGRLVSAITGIPAEPGAYAVPPSASPSPAA